MKNRKWIIISCMVLLGLGYIYLNKMELRDSFTLSSTTQRQSQLPKEIRLKATVVKLGFGRAVVRGFIEDSEETNTFNTMATYDSNGNLTYMRLSCLENSGRDFLKNRYIHLTFKDSKLIELELIEALTSYRTSKTESEVGVYSLKKLN